MGLDHFPNLSVNKDAGTNPLTSKLVERVSRTFERREAIRICRKSVFPRADLSTEPRPSVNSKKCPRYISWRRCVGEVNINRKAKKETLEAFLSFQLLRVARERHLRGKYESQVPPWVPGHSSSIYLYVL